MQRSGVVNTQCNVEDDNNPVDTHSVIEESTAEPPDAKRPPIDWPAMSEATKHLRFSEPYFLTSGGCPCKGSLLENIETYLG